MQISHRTIRRHLAFSCKLFFAIIFQQRSRSREYLLNLTPSKIQIVTGSCKDFSSFQIAHIQLPVTIYFYFPKWVMLLQLPSLYSYSHLVPSVLPITMQRNFSSPVLYIKLYYLYMFVGIRNPNNNITCGEVSDSSGTKENRTHFGDCYFAYYNL